MLDEYRQRRDNIHEWLTAHPGIQCVKPKGAFYLFPNISGLLSPGGVATSTDFAQGLLEKEHVVVTPGEAFDAPGYLRISYATSMEQLREGATRILRYAESLQPAKAARAVDDRGPDLRGVRRVAARAARHASRCSTTPRRSAAHAADAFGHGHPPEVVVRPADTGRGGLRRPRLPEARVPLVVRGAGTGYTGGAVPTQGGVVMSMQRLNRILQIDAENLIAVVQPAVITADLQRAVERVGLFYPPDPASLESVVDRRQRRRVRRRPARVQVRHDQALRAGARGRAADRRDHAHRVQGGQERRRLRPDAAAGRLGGHAGDRHRGNACGWCRCRRRAPRCRRRLPTCARPSAR